MYWLLLQYASCYYPKKDSKGKVNNLKINMMKYYLIENKLTDETNYSARILTERTINQDELIDKMLSKET